MPPPPAAATEQGATAAKAPHVLLAYQQAWVADRAQVKLWEKSRRIGASWCDAADSVLEAASATGQDALYIGYSEDMAREYIDDCAMWARSFQKAASEIEEHAYQDERTNIKAFRIDFASGRKVLALSSRPRSIRGKQGKVTIDEAAFHDQLEELLKAALAMLIWGGRVAVLSTHNGEDNAFNLLVKDIRAGKAPYALHRTDFDQALGAGLYERVKLILGKRLGYRLATGEFHEIDSREAWRAYIFAQYGERAGEELLCVPRSNAGAYIPRAVVERAQDGAVPVVRLAKPEGYELEDRRLEETDAWIAEVLAPVIEGLPNVRSVFGQDFGRDGDLSYCSVLQDAGGARWREALALELRRIPFDVQHAIIGWLIERLPLFHHGKFDARGNGQAHAEALLQQFGPARIECVMATPAWYAANFPPYKAALEDRSIAIAQGEDVIADHRRVVLKNGYPAMDAGRDKGSDGGYRHGDGAIARVLAWAATRTEGQPPAGASVEPELAAFLPAAMANRRRALVFRKAA